MTTYSEDGPANADNLLFARTQVPAFVLDQEVEPVSISKGEVRQPGFVEESHYFEVFVEKI